MKRRIAFLAVALVAALTAAVGMRPGDVSAASAVAGGPYYGVVGTALTFNGGASVGTCTWNFGDGTTATGCVVTKTYATPGTFGVVLTATDANNPTTATAVTTAFISAGGAYQPVPGYGCGTLCGTLVGAYSPCWYAGGCGNYVRPPLVSNYCQGSVGCFDVMTLPHGTCYGGGYTCGGMAPTPNTCYGGYTCGGLVPVTNTCYTACGTYVPTYVPTCNYCSSPVYTGYPQYGVGYPQYGAGYQQPYCGSYPLNQPWYNPACGNYTNSPVWPYIRPYDPYQMWYMGTNSTGGRVPICNTLGAPAVLCR